MFSVLNVTLYYNILGEFLYRASEDTLELINSYSVEAVSWDIWHPDSPRLHCYRAAFKPLFPFKFKQVAQS